MEAKQQPPIVFLSYSHDSDEHKDWVMQLATELRKVGIDVILDQWEIGPGDDVPKFMERSVSKSLRVIMICTEEYVRKADDGKGGAGYEAMVVTGELIADLGTRKFIPIVRQASQNKMLPKCLSGRYFVDFSDDGMFDEKLEELARDIHEAPAVLKPSLGENPFTSSRPETPLADATEQPYTSDPVTAYNKALGLAKSDNFQAWNTLVHNQKKAAELALKEWGEQNKTLFPDKKSALPEFFLPAVELYSAVFATALAGVDSGNDRFQNQLSLIDWLRNPKGWERSGYTTWVDLPDLLFFTYQACLGSFTLNRMLPQLTYNLATTPLGDKYNNTDKKPLFKSTRLMGWPESMAHTCTTARGFLIQYFESQEWLHQILGDKDSTLGSFSAYYSFLNILDFISAAKNGFSIESKDLPRVPLFSALLDSEHLIHGDSTLQANAKFLRNVVEENGLDPENIDEMWAIWMKLCYAWLLSVYSGHFHVSIPHAKFPEMIKTHSERLDTL